MSGHVTKGEETDERHFRRIGQHNLATGWTLLLRKKGSNEDHSKVEKQDAWKDDSDLNRKQEV